MHIWPGSEIQLTSIDAGSVESIEMFGTDETISVSEFFGHLVFS